MSKWYEYNDQMVNLDRVNYICKANNNDIPGRDFASILFSHSKSNTGDWFVDGFFEIVYIEKEEVYGEKRDKAFEEIKKILMESDSETKLPSRCY
jgi:hypothetical protein